MRESFWGISTDQLSSTHSICCEIGSTDEAQALFDGISYGKGSAFLKQLFNVLGYETMSKGLAIYFSKYEWKNTELPDFVGALEQAYVESGDKSMGEDFNLTSWCNTWLKSSGINILEPVVEHNEDGSIKSLKIKQSLGLRGQNRLRKQKLNVGLYEKAFAKGDSPFLIENVVISETEELTDIDISKLPSDNVLGAINVNHNEHAYCKVRFDKKSVQWFTENLHLVSNSVTRAATWRHFWMLVMDK